jgi:uncharacterized protein
MSSDPKVETLTPHYDRFADTRELLHHARVQANALGLDDYYVVDADSHREPDAHWMEVLEYVENPVMRRNSEHDFETFGRMEYVPFSNYAGTGYTFQAMHGRIAHQETQSEPLPDSHIHRDVELCRRAMDAISIDVQVVFPTSLLALGMAPVPEAEAELAYAYNRWMVERFISEESRIAFLPFLPLREPEMALRIVKEFAGRPGVVGFLVTSIRYDPVHSNKFIPIYAAIEETGLPIGFHAGPTWDDAWMKSMNRFLGVHAISFTHCNIVHMTNWLFNGLPERFPRLKTIWIESGLAWLPYLMQRLDHEYLKRSSEAPLLKRRPSEYMREMYYTSQPMETDNLELLESTMKAIDAKNQLIYASDWPHWDFDLPGDFLGFDFLDEEAKRNILGLNAARLFGLEPNLRVDRQSTSPDGALSPS